VSSPKKPLSCSSFLDDSLSAFTQNFLSGYGNLAKLSPNEYFSFVTTGVHPLDLPGKPSPPAILKPPDELGAHALEQETVSDSLIG
jgi:hypothetical protein